MPLQLRRNLGKNLNDKKRRGLTMEQLISVDVIHESIKGMKLAKSPGTDGFPIEFYEN